MQVLIDTNVLLDFYCERDPLPVFQGKKTPHSCNVVAKKVSIMQKNSDLVVYFLFS